jgi:hypothetical protein
MCDFKRQAAKLFMTTAHPSTIKPEQKLYEKILSLSTTDANTPYFSDIISKGMTFGLKLDLTADRDALNYWYSKEKENQPVNREEDWMFEIIERQLPDWQALTFSRWIEGVKDFAGLLSAPLCVEPQGPYDADLKEIRSVVINDEHVEQDDEVDRIAELSARLAMLSNLNDDIPTPKISSMVDASIQATPVESEPAVVEQAAESSRQAEARRTPDLTLEADIKNALESIKPGANLTIERKQELLRRIAFEYPEAEAKAKAAQFSTTAANRWKKCKSKVNKKAKAAPVVEATPKAKTGKKSQPKPTEKASVEDKPSKTETRGKNGEPKKNRSNKANEHYSMLQGAIMEMIPVLGKDGTDKLTEILKRRMLKPQAKGVSDK